MRNSLALFRIRLVMAGPMLLALSACTATPIAICPTPITYTAAQQHQAATELRALPDGSMLAVMIQDYGVERAKLRACNAP